MSRAKVIFHGKQNLSSSSSSFYWYDLMTLFENVVRKYRVRSKDLSINFLKSNHLHPIL